jgi:hypothetical protein
LPLVQVLTNLPLDHALDQQSDHCQHG